MTPFSPTVTPSGGTGFGDAGQPQQGAGVLDLAPAGAEHAAEHADADGGGEHHPGAEQEAAALRCGPDGRRRLARDAPRTGRLSARIERQISQVTKPMRIGR